MASGWKMRWSGQMFLSHLQSTFSLNNYFGYIMQQKTRCLLINSVAFALYASTSLSAMADKGIKDTKWWEQQKAIRTEHLQKYINDNNEDFLSFRTTPAGNTGIPMVIFRLLPEVFPEIWGSDDDKMNVVGLGPDLLSPNRPLPRGVGYAATEPPINVPGIGDVRLNVAQLTCSSCHSGVVTDENGQDSIVVGAPSPTFDFSLYRGLMAATVISEKYNAQTFIDALAQKEEGWLYNQNTDEALLQQERIERQIFVAGASDMLAMLKSTVLAIVERLNATLYATTYTDPLAPNPLAGHPGSMDAMGLFASLTVDPAALNLEEILPPKPAFSDHMPVWEQAGRPSSKWSGDVVDPTHANAFAALGTVGSPFTTNMDNTNRATRFSKYLPATPYPFSVRWSKMQRGKKIYAKACASCHAYGNENILSAEEVGTDPWRAEVLTPYTVTALRKYVRIACDDPITCNKEDGSPLADEEILRITRGYSAVPLDGIWARAPYLHNGSVPTMRALLTGNRPAVFYRGNTSYDQYNVGFTWDYAVGANAAIYDTSLTGNSNAGHTGDRFTGGIDFAKDEKKLMDLLEFLKTL